MANKRFWGILVTVLVLCMTVVGCDNGSTNNSSETGTSTETGTGNGSKVTITLSDGTGMGSIKLTLASGTWNTSGPWSATVSTNLSSIIMYLLEYGSLFDRTKCTAYVSGSVLYIDTKDSSGNGVYSGSVYPKTTLNPVAFPYTSIENVTNLSTDFELVCSDSKGYVSLTE